MKREEFWKQEFLIKIKKKKKVWRQIIGQHFPKFIHFCKFTLHIIVGKIKAKSGRNVGRKGKKGGWPEG